MFRKLISVLTVVVLTNIATVSAVDPTSKKTSTVSGLDLSHQLEDSWKLMAKAFVSFPTKGLPEFVSSQTKDVFDVLEQQGVLAPVIVEKWFAILAENSVDVLPESTKEEWRSRAKKAAPGNVLSKESEEKFKAWLQSAEDELIKQTGTGLTREDRVAAVDCYKNLGIKFSEDFEKEVCGSSTEIGKKASGSSTLTVMGALFIAVAVM